MKASKFIVLVAGLLGILAFFLPMIDIKGDNSSVPLSAFQIVKGLNSVAANIGGTGRIHR